MDTHLVVFVVCVFPITCHGLDFTSTPNATSETCDEGDFTFNWVYTSGTPTGITWTKRNNDGTLNATLGTYAVGSFAPDPAYGTRVTAVGNNGVIILSGTTAADNGVYQIELIDGSTSLKGNTTLSSFASDKTVEGDCKEVPFQDYTVTCRMQVVTPVTLQLQENGNAIASASSETGIEETGVAAFGKTLTCSAVGPGQQCMKNNNLVLEVPVPQLIITCIVIDIIGIITMVIFIVIFLKGDGKWQLAGTVCAAILIVWTFIVLIVISVKYGEGSSEAIFIVAVFFTCIGLILGVAALWFPLKIKCAVDDTDSIKDTEHYIPRVGK